MIRVGVSWVKGKRSSAPYTRVMAINPISTDRFPVKVHII